MKQKELAYTFFLLGKKAGFESWRRIIREGWFAPEKIEQYDVSSGQANDDFDRAFRKWKKLGSPIIEGYSEVPKELRESV